MALMLSTSTPSLHVSLHVSLHFSTALCATYFMPDAKHGAMGACVQERLEKRLVEPLWSTSTAKSWIKDDRASDSDRKKPFQKKDISHDFFGSSATDAAVSLKDLERF